MRLLSCALAMGAPASPIAASAGEAPRGVAVVRAERYIPVLDSGAAIPDLPLVDQDARPFSFRALDGRAAVVAFIYTRCGDARMCALVSAKFARLQRMIDPASMRLVEVTLDPGFDTPAVLRRYAAGFEARADRWTFLTGSAETLDELSRRLGIVSIRGAGNVILHSEALVIVDRTGRIAERVDGNTWTSEQALALAQKTVHGTANPFVQASLVFSSGIAAMCGGGTSGITLAAAIAIFILIAAALTIALRQAFHPTR